MAIKFSCDGCGVMVDQPHHRGLVLQKQYCDSCVSAVDEHLKAIDMVHTSAAQEYAHDVAALKLAYAEKFPHGKLPDES